MQSKSLLIAIAAFAVTTTGVSAYGNSVINRAGLSKDQAVAIEEAHELRAAGNLLAARDRLAAAGINEEMLRSLHAAANEVRIAVHEAVEAGDYEAFQAAVADSPLADIITSEADFKQFREAHELRKQGMGSAAASLAGHHHGIAPERPWFHHIELTDDQRAAFQVAKQANDRATMQAILDEAGLENVSLPQRPQHMQPHWR